MKIIPICSADRERLRINRFHRFCGLGLDFGKGVNFLSFWRVVWGLERVNFLWIGASGWVDFSELGFWQTVRNFDRLCGMLWESETLSEKAFCFWFFLRSLFTLLNISTFSKMRRSLRLEAKRKIIECQKKCSDKHTVEGKHYRLPNR